MQRFLSTLVAPACLHVVASHNNRVSYGRYIAESGTATHHSADPEDRTYKPFAEARFTQPTVNEDKHVEFTVRVDCTGDPEMDKVDDRSTCTWKSTTRRKSTTRDASTGK